MFRGFTLLTVDCHSVLLDLCVTARPVRMGHIIYPILVGLSYAAFSLIYCVLGGTDKVGNR